MEPQLLIYPARLHEGRVEKISETIDGAGLSFEGVRFAGPIAVEGEAYLAGQHMIIRLHLRASAFIPCRICGEEAEVALEVPDFYSAEEEVSSGVFDCFPLIRESLLLELPFYVECHGGHCPHRAEMVKYLDHPSKDGYHPFNP